MFLKDVMAILFYCMVMGLTIHIFIRTSRLNEIIHQIQKKHDDIFNNKSILIKYVNKNQRSNSNINKQFKYNAASCFDIESAEEVIIKKHGRASVDSCLIFDLPYTHELQIRPRSGLSSKGIQAQFGTVDSDYIGTVKVTIYNMTDEDFTIKVGDRIAQGFINKKDFYIERDTFEEVLSIDEFNPEKLKHHSRGKNGFGSTGI